MSSRKNHKLCFHCNAEVDVDVIVCPFCGVDLMHEKHLGQDEYEEELSSRPLSTHETLASLYPPPYKSEYFHTEGNIPQEMRSKPHREESFSEIQEEEKPQKSPLFKGIFLFSLGVNLLFFSLFLFLFSNEGVVRFSLNARFWVLYLILSLPLVFLGYRFLSREESEPAKEFSEE